MPPTVAILLHARDRTAARRNYRVWPIAECMKRLGCDVRVLRGPPSTGTIEADILIPQVDCSHLTGEYRAAIEAHPRCVNGTLFDIRKRSISPNVILAPEDHDGPVILKTNNNSGGFRDLVYHTGEHVPPLARLRMALAWSPKIRPIFRAIEDRRLGTTRTLTRYPLFDSAHDVPKEAWTNPHLVVEKFRTPDRDDRGRYVMHMWIPAGNIGTGRTLAGSEPYVKDRNAELGFFDQPPPEIEAERKRLGLDYGKIDYIIERGTPHVIDVNWSPTVSGDAMTDRHFDECMPLARGLLDRFGAIADG
ncbi:MAG: hypothetical protein AAFR96_10685 [Planctomycetota bacterium]